MNNDKIVLFYPHIPESAKNAARAVLDTRWIGQGPKVDEFEAMWTEKFASPNKSIAVGSGTDALHLAYLVAGIKEGDEVVAPVFTCLQGKETVLLPNNKYEVISKLVSEKYDGEVVSFNEKTGELENKKVIGWYKHPFGNSKWFNISTENSKNTNTKDKRRGVWVTNDHQFLTSKRGFVRADKLKVNDYLITKYPELNGIQISLFIGMMLGDGSIRTGRNSESSCCRFNFDHTESQKDWLDIKTMALNGFNYKKSEFPVYKRSKKRFNTTFESVPRWAIERKNWYEGKKKILPKNIDWKDFNALTLATWYMDDGNLHKNGAAIICSDNFSYKENLKLSHILIKSGIRAKVQISKRGSKYIYRIYIGNGNNGGMKVKNPNTDKFFREIAPYVVPCLRYKLPQNISKEVPYKASLWNLGTSITFVDKVVIKTGIPKISQSHMANVYCIDVEDNHNFISKSVVLHNCTATNEPLLYQRAKIVFADINKDNLNIDPVDVARKVNARTKAIVAVDYGGLPADLVALQTIADKWGIPFIEDAAQAHGAKYAGRWIGSIADYTTFSFQAIKIITTCDGGMLTIKNPELEDKAKRIRWFGIDRKAKMADRWMNDIVEVGYKYQMTDFAAAMGLEALKEIDTTLAYHRKLFETYREGLKGIPGITFIGDDEIHQSSCWLCTVLVENRDGLKAKLAANNIESNPVHYRNDRYTIFGGRVKDCPNMDALESKYLVLPMHWNVTEEQVKMICDIIRGGW